MRLEPNLAVVELAALQRVHLMEYLPLLRRSPVIVKRHHLFGRARQVGDDVADAGVQFAGMPFNLGNDTAFPAPRSSLIAEAGVIAPHMAGWTANGTRQKMGNSFLKNFIGFGTDEVFVILTFQKFIKVRRGKAASPRK